MHERCPIIVNYCYVDSNRQVHHLKHHFDPNTEWSNVYSIARVVAEDCRVAIYPISLMTWLLIGEKNKKANGHALLSNHYYPILHEACLPELCDNSRQLYLYIVPVARFVIKAQVWSPIVYSIDIYTLGIGDRTATIIGNVIAGYDTDIDDVVAQCINSRYIGYHVYILPVSLLSGIYWRILRRNLRGASGVLPRVAPTGPNGLVRVANSILPNLMDRQWILLTCVESNGHDFMPSVLRQCIDAKSRASGIYYNHLFLPPFI